MDYEGWPTQKAWALDQLRRGPLCTSDFLRHYISRGADVVLKLRKDGHAISTAVCTDPAHNHRKGVRLASYTMEGEWDPKGGNYGLGAWRD